MFVSVWNCDLFLWIDVWIPSECFDNHTTSTSVAHYRYVPAISIWVCVYALVCVCLFVCHNTRRCWSNAAWMNKTLRTELCSSVIFILPLPQKLFSSVRLQNIQLCSHFPCSFLPLNLCALAVQMALLWLAEYTDSSKVLSRLPLLYLPLWDQS